MVILMKAVKAKRLQIDAVRLELLNELRKVGREMQKDFERTTKTWQGDKPDFPMLISLAKGGPTLLIEPNGPGSDKWRWLNEGTDVRYATMSPDFEAKTSPKVVDSRRGRGGVLFVNRKRPRPGIEAREWTGVIAKKWRRPFKKRMEGAMVRGAKKSGHYLKR